MAKTFNYNGEVLWSDEITVESVSNVCLEAVDSIERCYYLIAITQLGETKYLEFGPVYPEDESLPSDYTIHYETFECSDNVMIKKISKFLGPKKFIGNKKVKVASVKELKFDEAITYGINPLKYMNDLFGTKEN